MILSRLFGLLLLVGFVAAGTARGVSSDAPTFSAITPIPLDLSSKSWGEVQFIQADLQGRIFVLRGSPTLEVFALEGVSLRSLGKLAGATAGISADSMQVQLATLSRSGDAWYLFVPTTTIEVFEGGKRTRSLVSHWEVTDLASGSSEPTVAVTSTEFDTPSPEGPTLDHPPLVRRWDGKAWETTIQGEYHDEKARPGVSWHHLDLAASSMLLAFTPEGQLWVANAYTSRVRHFSALGRLEDEIVVGDGKIRWAERNQEEIQRIEAKLGTQFQQSGAKAAGAISSTVPRATHRALALGRDGYVYLLGEADEGMVLDRYLPSLPTYERLVLVGCDLGVGRISFAAGRHALILGARLGNGGIWEIPYEALSAAKWKSVQGVTRNGIELPSK